MLSVTCYAKNYAGIIGWSLTLSLLCFQFHLLFLPEFPIIFTHYSYFIPIPSPIIPINFYYVSDNEVHSLFSSR